MLTDGQVDAEIGGTEVRACGACGASGFVVDSRRPGILPGARKAVRTRCTECELEAYQPQPCMHRFSDLFDNSYFDSGYAAFEALRRRLIDRALIRLRPYLAGQSRILDFGAGAGFWSERLRTLGHSVDTVEPSAAARRRLLAGGFDAGASLEDVTGPYDVILLMDVLGSCENPAGLLAQLGLRLRPGGYLVVRTPHFQGAWRRCLEEIAYRKRETPPWYPTILWRFRPNLLESCLQRAGLDAVETWYEIQPWTLRTGGWKSRMLWRMCSLWDRLTGNGDEFYTIGRKPAPCTRCQPQ